MVLGLRSNQKNLERRREWMTEFGALMFPTDYAMKPAKLAKAIEEREMEEQTKRKV